MLTTTARAILLGALLCLNFQFVTAQAVTWASQIDYGNASGGNSGGGTAFGMDVDGLGNTVSCGIAWGPVDFGGGIVSTAPISLGYVTKHDPVGNTLWARRFSSGGGNMIYDVETAANGDVYFASTWSNAQDFWGIPVPALPALNHGAILGKFDASGNIQWLKTYPGTGQGRMYELETAPNGDIFMIGTFSDSLDLAGQGLNSVGEEDAFVSRVDPNGNILWTQHLEGNFADFGTYWLEMSSDPTGNLVLSTYLVDSARIAGQLHVAQGGGDLLLIKFDPQGNHLWTIQEGGPALDFPSGLGHDATGNIYWTGQFRDTLSMGGFPLQASPNLSEIWLAKLDPMGNYIWVNSAGSSSSDAPFSIAVKSNGDFFMTGTHGGTATFGNVVLPPKGTAANFFVVKYDGNGNALWGESWGNPGFGGPNNGAPVGIALDPAGNPRVAGYFRGTYDFNGIQLAGSGQSSDGYVMRILDNSNLITGQVYRDFNQNGNIDAGDTGFPGAIIEMTPGPRYYFSGPDGGYYAGTGTGNYSLSIPNPPLYHTVTAPATQTANFAALGQVDSLNNFGIYPIPNSNDLRLSLDNVHPPRPGDTIYYRMRIKNVGTTSQVPDLSFLPALELNFLGATPNFQSTTNDTLFWTLPSLAPQAESFVVVAYTVPLIPIISLGDTLSTYAQVEPISNDLAPLDNVGSLNEVIVGSYDPNDKAVSPSGNLDPAEVAAGTWLDYKIRFQNTGTDTAFQVVVRDTLDMDLDIASFEMLSASHDYDLYLTGQGELAWRFNNINLPDSNVNEAASHGFIRYRIRPKATLSLGTVIENTAHIYFDYNPAIVTNTTVSTVQLSTAFADPAWTGLSVQVYPNPSEGQFTIALEAAKAGNCNTVIYDLQGRKLIANQFKHGQGRFDQVVDARALPAGVYVLEIESGGAKRRQRIVLR